MVKITIKNKQAVVTIPIDIMSVMEWKEGTEIMFVPFIIDPKIDISKEVPIILKEIKKGSKR